jgi:hypothetical protein
MILQRSVPSFLTRISNKQVFNFSSQIIPKVLLDILSLNSKFIPEPQELSDQDLRCSFQNFARIVRFRYKYWSVTEKACPSRLDLLFRVKKPEAMPPKASPIIERYLKEAESKIESQLTRFPAKTRLRDPRIMNLLKLIKSNLDIQVCGADKNCGQACLDRPDYEKEGIRQLSDNSTYKRLTTPPDRDQLFEPLHQLLSQFAPHLACNTPICPETLTQFLLQAADQPLKLARFYLLLKVHKQPITGRPVVSSIGYITYNASKFLDVLLQPYVKRIPSYIQDSDKFILQLEQQQFPHDCCILTADVENLYPSIDIDDGLRCLELFLTRQHVHTETIRFIIALAEWVLKTNILTFGNSVWLQIRGTAMGTPFAVAFASIYLSVLEQETWDRCQLVYNFQLPLLFDRFIDDIYSIFRQTTHAETFVEIFQQRRPTISITFNISTTSGIFLDVETFKGTRFSSHQLMDVKLYSKPINPYLYISPDSYHPRHVFTSTSRSLTKRLGIRCSNIEDFDRESHLLHSRLLARGYPSPLLLATVNRPPEYTVYRQNLLHNIATRRPKEPSDPPLIFKTHANPRLARLNLTKCLEIHESIFADPAARVVFGTNNPILCRQRAKNIGDLVKSSTYKFDINESFITNPAAKTHLSDTFAINNASNSK